MTEQEIQTMLKTPNCELSDEALSNKRNYFWGLARLQVNEGADNIAANNYERALECIKEQERRSGKVQNHAFLERLILDLRGLIPKRKPARMRRKRKTRKRRTAQCPASTEQKRKNKKRVPS